MPGKMIPEGRRNQVSSQDCSHSSERDFFGRSRGIKKSILILFTKSKINTLKFLTKLNNTSGTSGR